MPDLEKMSTEEKNWFASAIAGMIVADGHTDKKERRRATPTPTHKHPLRTIAAHKI